MLISNIVKGSCTGIGFVDSTSLKVCHNRRKGLFSKFFAERGYVSQELATQLLEELGIEFFAPPKRNMKNKLMRLHDKFLSRQRALPLDH